MRHGLTRKGEATAIVTKKIGDVLENAIKVNELNARGRSAAGYVLFGIGQDADGNLYPTRIVVNNYGGVDDVEVLDVLYAVNAKRRTSPQTRQGVAGNPAPLIKGSSKISIADLLYIVKDDFSDVLSDDVLNELGVQRKNSTLSESLKFKESLTESEDNYGRNDLLSGNGGRGHNESAGKQTERISRYKQELEGKTRAERKETAKELLAKGLAEEKIEKGHKFTLVKPEAYNEDMQQIVDKAKSEGKEVGFFIGPAQRMFDNSKVDGINFGNGKILIRYDGVRSPQTLLVHEDVHTNWYTPEIQKAKDIILGDLTEAEKKEILSNGRYRKYMKLYRGNKDAVWEEFVADVFAGMNDYSEDYVDMVADYHYDGKIVDRYSPSEYNEIIDGGGNALILDNIGFGGENRIAYSATKKWHTDLSKQQFEILENEIKKDAKSGKNYITKTTKWLYEDIGGIDVLAIYSTEDVAGPTLLYESKGKKAETEREILELWLEERKYARSNDEKSKIVDQVFDSIGLQRSNGVENSNGLVGRGSGNRNVAILRGTSRRNPSRAFRSVLENLFKIQDDNRGNTGMGGGRGVDPKYTLTAENDEDLKFLEDFIKKCEEYGVIPKGENPARDIDVPKKISKDKVVSRFARTLLEAGITPNENVSDFEKAILNGEMTHEIITNKKSQAWAKQQIEYLGFEEALKNWTVLSESNKIGKNEFALGMELYNQCITRKDVHNAMKIAAELAAEATRAGQTVQACRMLKLMTPDGQLYYLEKSIQKMSDEFKEKLGDKFKGIELDEKLVEEFLNENDNNKRNVIYDRLCQNIADQIPATKLDKWNSWRYLSMLGNPRTHIRNIVGNAIFIPSVRLKNYIGAIIEKSVGIKTDDRTKSWFKTKEAIAFAEKDFEAMRKVLQGENAKYAVTGDIEGKRTIFKTKWLEKLRTKNFDFLEAEDMWFLKAHYVDSLARLITVRKIDANKISPQTLDILRAFAVKEAQAATYRDANALADGLNRLQRKLGRSDNKAVRATSVLIEGVMPFKKTPLNIAKQGVNYSPIGLLKGAYKALKMLKEGNTTADEVIDDFAKGLTGTGIMLLGLWLASLGLLVGADDKSKKEKDFEKMVGEQSYALKIKKAFTYTLDWMVPSNLSLFVGAKLYDLTKDDFSFADIVDALSTVTEPLLELSVFSGLNGVIESAQYSDSEALLAIASDMTTNYMMQALPTIGGQISRILDDSKREYYFVDKNSSMPKGLQRIIGQASSKIPGASYLFQPSVDVWGRDEKYGNIVERAFENTVSPGYYAAYNYTAVDEELKELYERTGESSVLPVTQQKYYKEDKIFYYMTAKNYTEAKRLRGQKSYDYISRLISDEKVFGDKQEKVYSKMSDDEKVKAIKKCYDKAGDETKAEMLDKVKATTK